MPVRLDDLAALRTSGTPRGMTSVCSAHPVVTRAALRYGLAAGADHALDTITPTDRQPALKTIAVHKRQFEEAGLSEAFTRVIGLVAPLDPEDVLIWRVTQSLKAYHAACNL